MCDICIIDWYMPLVCYKFNLSGRYFQTEVVTFTVVTLAATLEGRKDDPLSNHSQHSLGSRKSVKSGGSKVNKQEQLYYSSVKNRRQYNLFMILHV